MSVNLEMPTNEGLKLVAPEKDHESVKKPLDFVNNQIKSYNEDRQLIKSTPMYVPAGQSTQMVIGATPENDYQIMSVADKFYKDYNLKRVYYSGYIPINNDNPLLPQVGTKPPLVRENRLYQTDWLLRFYKFDLNELLNEENQDLDLAIDPKLSWALRNPHFFPVDINTADYRDIIRIPGIGRLSAMKIIKSRQFGKLHLYQIKKMGVAYNRAKYFMRCADTAHSLGFHDFKMIKTKFESEHNASSIIMPSQLSLF